MSDEIESVDLSQKTPEQSFGGKPVPFEDLKETMGTLNLDQLLRGLRLDQEKRWHRGQRALVEEYLRAFPNLSPDHMVMLISGEIIARRGVGEEPTLTEYALRFPELAARLALHFPPAQPDPEPAPTQTPEPDEGPSGPTLMVSEEVIERTPPKVPGYEVQGQLGRGGMGIVYKAQQISLNRTVAIKMILAGTHAKPGQMEAFEREANLAARLRHPNIVQIFEVDVRSSPAFLVMEYVEGGSLAQKIGGQPQDPLWSARITEALALAVEEAHRKGIIHRDLKPANVLLHKEEPDPTLDQKALPLLSIPKIVDFGLAHVFENDNQLSTTNAYLGTPSYMSPEQADGRAKDIGVRTDVYGLGAILYELLTGQPPFRGESPWETLSQIREIPAVAPRRSQPNVPRDLETICLKCLEKEPARRYASAAELAADLRRFRQGEAIKGRPVSSLEKAARWCRRNPGWAAMFATTALLLIVIAVGALLSASWLEERLERAEAAEKDARKNELLATKAENAARQSEWQATMAQARSLQTSQRSGQRFKSLSVLQRALELARELKRPQEDINDVRDQWVASSALPDLYVAAEWPGYPPGSTVVDFTGNLDMVARLDAQGNCSVRKLSKDPEHNFIVDSELFTIPAPKGVGRDATVTFSRDGRFLALQYGNGLLNLYAVGGQKATCVLTEKEVHHLDFSPTATNLVLGHLNGSLSWYDPANGKLKTTSSIKSLENPLVAVHPSEPLVAVWSNTQPGVEIHDLRDGRLAGHIPSGNQPVPDVAWRPDGKVLAASTPSGIVLHEQSAHFKPGPLLASVGPVVLSFDPTGKLLAALGWKHEVILIRTDTGEKLFTLPALAPPTSAVVPIRRLRFDNQGKRLAGRAHKDRLTIWNVAQGDELLFFETIAKHDVELLQGQKDGTYTSMAISPRLPNLLAATAGGGLGFWDVETGKRLAFSSPKDTANQLRRAVFEPSGSLLACGAAGTFRYPVRNFEGRLHVGPPEVVNGMVCASDLALSGDGKVIAVSAWNKGADKAGGVSVQQAAAPQRIFDEGENISCVAVSPNGRWLAWGFEGQARVKIWDLKNNVLAKEFLALGTVPSFSADSQWLAVSGNQGGLFAVGTWAKQFTFSGMGVFSHDSKLCAVEDGTGRIALMETATGKTLGHLENPNLIIAESLLFTPDDSKLLVTNNGPRAGICVWDLALVAANLQKAGLGWKVPPFDKGRGERPEPLPGVELDFDR